MIDNILPSVYLPTGKLFKTRFNIICKSLSNIICRNFYPLNLDDIKNANFSKAFHRIMISRDTSKRRCAEEMFKSIKMKSKLERDWWCEKLCWWMENLYELSFTPRKEKSTSWEIFLKPSADCCQHLPQTKQWTHFSYFFRRDMEEELLPLSFSACCCQWHVHFFHSLFIFFRGWNFLFGPHHHAFYCCCIMRESLFLSNEKSVSEKTRKEIHNFLRDFNAVG